MVRMIVPLILALGLTGCSHTQWEDPKIPTETKPSSASIRPEELSNDEVKYLKKDRAGRVIGRKFDKNKRKLIQSNRWINWKEGLGWFPSF